MKPVFADSFYYIALLNDRDGAHDAALELTKSLRSRIVTTTWVLTEVADAFSDPLRRAGFGRLIDVLGATRDARVIAPSRKLFDHGVALYRKRIDKHWSLTDCISFYVMHDRGISDALTGDRHFEQAGFRVLLR